MKYKNLFIVFVLLLISFIPLLDLFKTGFPVTHDGQDHIARIANFYQNLKEGIILPRWAGNLNWGYGHPILMFLYPLPSYLTSFFHFLSFSLIDSVKIVFGLAFVLSGLTMYLWVKNFLGRLQGFLAAVLYLFAPYRFIDLYVRGALGEHVAFIFPPLICYFLLKLSKKYSLWYVIGGSISLAGLILSHNAISLIFLPLILFYIFYLFKSNKNSKTLLINSLIIIILGFSLSAFFWLPAFLEGRYTLRYIVTAGEYLSRFVEPLTLIYGSWNYGGTGVFTVQIGIIQLISILLSPILIFVLFKNKNKNAVLLLGFMIYLIIVIFLMLVESNFIWQRFTILQNFQFPWRFLSVVVFITAVLGGFVLKSTPKKIYYLIFIIMCFGSILLTKNYWKAESYLQEPESFFTGVYNGTTDTGESAPIWSVRFMEKRAKEPIQVILGKGEVKQSKRIITHHKYEVNAFERIRIRENTLYFPGWKVFIDGKPAEIEFQDPQNRGLITFFVNEGKHAVDVRFTETKLRFMADMISLLSALSIIGYILIKLKKI